MSDTTPTQTQSTVSLTYQDLPGCRGRVAVSDADWRRFHIAGVAQRHQLPVFETGAGAWLRAPELIWRALGAL